MKDEQDLESQLTQSQKLEAIGRLAGGVAHDLNNMMTAVTGYVDLALLHADERSRGYLMEAKLAAERTVALTRQLLAFGRGQVLRPEPLDLAEAIGSIHGMLDRLIGGDIEVVTSFGHQGRVLADRSQLEQVLVNLAVNAADAMPGGGRITIETQNAELDEEFARSHPGAVPGRYVLFAFGDDGHGMDAETRDRLFEPFYTTKEVGRGTGLGLSTVYGIIRQSDGYITVESEVGRGTVFRVYLPRVDAVAVGGRLSSGSFPTIKRAADVLLVDDEDLVRELMREVLAGSGHRVRAAGSAEEALERAAAGAVDLLVTDVVMPRMNGRELAERVLLLHPHARVLFTSGYTSEAVGERIGLEADAHFLQKPFSVKELARAVDELVR